MKKYLLPILLFTFFISFSQSKNYKVDYELTRTKGQFIFNADGVLEISPDKNISKFSLGQYKNLLKNGDKKIDTDTKDTINVLGSNRICTDNKVFFFDYKNVSSRILIYNKYCKSKVLIKEPLNIPKWKINDNTKIISGYKCQEATAYVNDRKWTVYFTNELKIKGGPWRLIGLPGIVIRAKDSSSTYEFNLIKIKETLPKSIAEPKYKKESTFSEFIQKAIKRQTDEMYFRLSKFANERGGEIDRNDFPLYETLEFIEKRK